MATAFNSVVAARTRLARHILDDAELLAKWKQLGGLQADLEVIREAGLGAEARNVTQGQVRADGKVATLDVVLAFDQLRNEYSGVMGVLTAVLGDLKEDGPGSTLIAKVEAILKNEAEVGVSTATDAAGAKKRTTRKKATQEAIRAEIQKDAASLISLAEIHDRLGERAVAVARLEQLRDAAVSLSGKLAARAAKKGEGKEATAEERALVARQSAKWGSISRLLGSFGQRDPRVKSLLADIPRPSRKTARKP